MIRQIVPQFFTTDIVATVDPEEQRFVQRALAEVEKAARFHRIKQIVVSDDDILALIHG